MNGRRVMLCSLALLMCSGTGFGQTPKQESEGFVWEDDSLQAFIKAVEQQKPLVVLFGSPPAFRSPQGTNFTNAIRKEFDKKELLDLRDKAVFTLGFPEEDEFARRMASRLKLTDFPTISIIKPNTDRLTEHYRMEGFFTAAEIVKNLKAQLATAMPKPAPEETAAQNKAEKGEKSALSEADKKAIQQAVSAYEAAFKAGDLDQVAKLSAQPFGFVYEQGFMLAKQVGKSKRAILQAMDKRFGKEGDSIPYGTDDEKIRQQMMKLNSLYILDYDTALGKIVTLQVEATLTSGKTEPWKLIANRPTDPGGKWMVWPKLAAGTGEIGTSEDWQTRMKKLAVNYEDIAAEIKKGKYANREAAKWAALEAYTRAMSPVFGDGKSSAPIPK